MKRKPAIRKKTHRRSTKGLSDNPITATAGLIRLPKRFVKALIYDDSLLEENL